MTDRLLLLWDIDGALLRYGGAREHGGACRTRDELAGAQVHIKRLASDAALAGFPL